MAEATLAISFVVSRDNPLFLALTGVGLVGLVASFHGILIAASRAILELGRAGYAPKLLGEVHATTGTPTYALVANLVVGLIALATGKTGSVILIAVFGALTLYVLSSAAVLRLRVTEPDLARPYRTPLYPVTPIAALVLSLVCLAAMAWSYPAIAAIYGAILAVSSVLFLVLVPAHRRTTF